jgi:hypothetical protein
VIDGGPRAGQTPWDPPGTYGSDPAGVVVEYRGETVREPVRDRAWKLAHLHHDGSGRIVV